MDDNIQITQIETIETITAKEKVSYDIQIATAKRYPRDILKAKNNAIAIATLDTETAQSCGYAIPRGDTPIQGPSVHLAKILAQNWGNLRIEAKVIDTTPTQIVSSAVCFDLENNLAIKVEVRRKITNSKGLRFNEDMITVTGNAANAIALRNAIFAVIPEQITKAAYGAAMDKLAGDVATEAKLIKSRDTALRFFKDTYAVTEAQILKAIGKNAIGAIGRDQIVLLGNMKQSLADGDSTVEEMFAKDKVSPLDKKAEMKNKKDTKPTPKKLP